jgi:hypothetical protein
MVTELSYSGSFAPIQNFNQFETKLEALCGLPARHEWATILELSKASELPAIWRRARLSPLEDKAIQIFSVLAFSPRKRWNQLIRQFFKYEGWQIDLRGRPTLDARDEESRPLMRGLQIEQYVHRLSPGYRAYVQLTKHGNYASEERIAMELEKLGFDAQERKAIVSGRSPQDVGCRYFFANQTDTHVDLKSIRNDYAKFKKLTKAV